MGTRGKPILRDRENREEMGFDAGRPIETAVLGSRHS